MNILYINHYAGGPAYGMEYRSYYLAREWVRAGHIVTIVAASQSHVRSRQPSTNGAFTVELVDGVRFVWCATPRYDGNGIGRVVNIVAFLLRLGQSRRWLDVKPDVVIASSTYPLDIGPAQRLARRHAATLIWEVHDLWPLSPIELGGMSRRHPFIRWLQHAEDKACRVSDRVVSMLPMADAHLVSRGMDRSKFVHVPNGVDPDEWVEAAAEALPVPHQEAIRKLRGAGSKLSKLICYAGAHGVANALPTLLDAARLCTDDRVTFILVGTGPDKSALRDRAMRDGLRNVVFLDPVPKASIPSLLRAMDILYIGLQREPLFRFGISPNKLMDYMMAARPIVCAIEAGNDPVTQAGCGLTVAPENPQAVAQAVRQLAAVDSEQLDRMGRNGRAWVESRHSYPVLAKQFIAVMRGERV